MPTQPCLNIYVCLPVIELAHNVTRNQMVWGFRKATKRTRSGVGGEVLQGRQTQENLAALRREKSNVDGHGGHGRGCAPRVKRGAGAAGGREQPGTTTICRIRRASKQEVHRLCGWSLAPSSSQSSAVGFSVVIHV